MKKVKVNLSKLELNKERIMSLTPEAMASIKGGEGDSGSGATILYCVTAGKVCNSVKVVLMTIQITGGYSQNGNC